MSMRTGLALACVLFAGTTTAAATDTGEAAATLRRAHLAFLLDTEQPRQALLQARARPALTQKTDPVVLARALAEYGLLEEAVQHYNDTGNGGDPRRSQAWLSLAEAWYERDRHSQALHAVRQIFGNMPDSVAQRSGPLEGRILLAQEEPEKAVDTLRKTLQRYDNPLARFNLGVALVRAGHNEEGAGELNAVGQLEPRNAHEKTLRDKANITLAYGYLTLEQGATARALFDRVRLDGPYSNRALLGLGWAELAPDGDPQTLATIRPVPCVEDPARLLPDSMPVLRRPPREACGPPEQHRDRDEFETRESADSERARYKRALVPWTELIERTGGAQAIQEALVAAPYAYRELGAMERARRGFERAIQRLDARNQTVRAVLERLRKPSTTASEHPDTELTPAWLVRRWELPPGNHSAYLAPLVADTGFRLTARAVHDLAVLDKEMAAHATTVDELSDMVDGFIDSITRNNGSVPDTLHDQRAKLDALAPRLQALRNRLDKHLADREQHLRRLARDNVQAYKRQLEVYLQHARRGRASVHDATTSQGGNGP